LRAECLDIVARIVTFRHFDAADFRQVFEKTVATFATGVVSIEGNIQPGESLEPIHVRVLRSWHTNGLDALEAQKNGVEFAFADDDGLFRVDGRRIVRHPFGAVE
jgi:hypothetical protein